MAESDESLNRGQGRRPVIIGNQNERAMLYKIADSLSHLQNSRTLPSPGSDASRTSGTSTPKDGVRKCDNYAAVSTSTTAALEEIKKSLQTFKKDDPKQSEIEAQGKVSVQELIDQMNSDRQASKYRGLASTQAVGPKSTRPHSDEDTVSTNTITDNGASSPPPPLPPRPRGTTSSPAPPLPPPRDQCPSRPASQYRQRQKEPPAGSQSSSIAPRGVSPSPARLVPNGTASNAPNATPPSTLEQLSKQTGYSPDEIQRIIMEHTRNRNPQQTNVQPLPTLPSYNEKHVSVPTGNGPPPTNYPKPHMNGIIPHQQPAMQQQLTLPPPYPANSNYMQSPASSVTSGSSNDCMLMSHLKSTPYGESPSSATTPANTDHPQPPSYNSSLHAQVSSSPKSRTFAQSKPATTNGSHAPTGNSVHIKIRNHQEPHLQVTGNPNFHVSASHAQQPQPGIPSQLESNRQSIQIQFSTPISNPVVDPHVGRKGSTETRSDSPVSRTTNQSPLSMVSSTASTNSDFHPPPPYPGPSRPPPHNFSVMQTPDSSELSETEQSETDSIVSTDTTRCTSPIPKLKPDADKARDDDKHWSKLRSYSPAAFKFYMEQHIENVLKQHRERIRRRVQLENELVKIQGMSEEARQKMRALLHKKESNYLRLRRAKLNRTMFEVIKKLGVGAFGEVTLVRKKGIKTEGASADVDTHNDSQKLYAMKTLRKVDVIRRNQVAHVKAERDMLAEAELEWVTKLYYSFQDKENLYFIMEYIPGGDLMALLIKKGIFDEPMSRFFIAELVLAIESVHTMGFIHRDIKPDNILIDANGHIKLTDFGLCTGFRWTHNSKYYQEGHNRQDSMDISDSIDPCNCPKELPKILEKRRRKEKQRCTAHSLVGTPNYIAPEVLLRQGYTKTCDWWSVGVILYEMLVGQPPFLANSPKDTQIKVVNWDKYLRIPDESNLTKHASSLIVQLCTSTDRRLGKNGAAEIKQHPFFKSVDFANIRKIRPPYKPVIRYPTDTSNFDDVEEHDTQPPYKVDDLRQNGQFPEHAFSEFTFRRFFDDGGLNTRISLTDQLSLSNDLNQLSVNSSEPATSAAAHQTSTSSQNDRTPQNSYVEEETRAGNPVYV